MILKIKGEYQMPKYVRKKRYQNYNSKYCKKYLRIDFKYECAYCGTHEAESINGLKSFEIDHFKPRKKFIDDLSINNYDNLFYSCIICNSSKSDAWEMNLLNPCTDDIFGEDAHIIEGIDEKFKLIPRTKQGEDFIKILKLNQKTQREIRQIRSRYKTRVEERIKQIEKLIKNIKKLEELKDLSTDDIFGLLDKLEKEFKGPYFELLDESSFDKEYEALLEKTFNSIFPEEKVELHKVYEEHDLDYEIRTNNEIYRAFVRFEEDITFIKGFKQIRIRVEQARDWSTLSEPIVILLYDSSNQKIYYISFNSNINIYPIVSDSLYSLKIHQDFELEQRKDDFFSVIKGVSV